MAETILITGTRAPVALDMARDFRQAGYEVILADCCSAYMAKWSNTAREVVTYASPVYQPEQFRRDIKDLINRFQPKLLIPTCEEVFHLAHADLERSFKDKLFAPSLSVLDQLHNKATFNSLCLELNISAPETHIIDRHAILQAYQSSSSEWVLKPSYSRFGAQTLVQPSIDQLKTVRPSEQDPWIAQKFITGKECSFYAVSHNGKLLASSVYQSDWRLKGGASYVFTPANLDAEKQAKIIAETLAQKLDFTGQFSCDLIIDDDGTPWLIECNPRATSGLHLLTGSGDLARSIGDNTEYQVPLDAAKKYMFPMMMSYGLIKAIKEQKYKDWLSTLKSGADVISSKNDRLPVLGSLIDTLIFARQALKSNLSLSQATTYDIEWNGEARS